MFPEFVAPEEFELITVVPDTIWTLEGKLQYNMGRLIGTFYLPHRCTIVRLSPAPSRSSDELLVISPFPPSEALFSKIAEVGRVRYILAPNAVHWLWAAPFKRALQQREGTGTHEELSLYGVSGLKQKLPPDHVSEFDGLGKESFPLKDWKDKAGLELFFMEGCKRLDEVVLFHAPSRSLLITDMAFNLAKEDVEACPALVRWYVRTTGAEGTLCTNKLFYYIVEDPPALKQWFDQLMRSIGRVDIIVMAHGKTYKGSGRDGLLQGVGEQLQTWEKWHNQRWQRRAIYLSGVVAAGGLLAASLFSWRR